MSGNRRRARRIPLSVRAFGLGLRALAAVAPGRADRVLAHRFATPARRPGRPSPELYEHGRFVLHGGRRLPVWVGGRGRGPRVLLAHGWDSHGAFWDPLARALVEAGHEVVAFDMPAHGAADGRRTHVFAMAGAILSVGRALGPFAAVVGHSAGATATALALRDGLEAGRAVLLAAPIRPATFMFPLAQALGLRHERALAALDAMAREVGLDPFQADTVAAARVLRVPGLVIHDHDDTRAAWDDGRAIADAWRGARFLSTRGLGHSRLAADPGVVREVTAFVAAAADRPARRETA